MLQHSTWFLGLMMENANNRPCLDNFHHCEFSDSVTKYTADTYFTALLNILPGIFIKNNFPDFLWLWNPAIISRNRYFHGAQRLQPAPVSTVPLMFMVWGWSSLGCCAVITAKIKCNKPSGAAALTNSRVKLQWRIGFWSKKTDMGSFLRERSV